MMTSGLRKSLETLTIWVFSERTQRGDYENRIVTEISKSKATNFGLFAVCECSIWDALLYNKHGSENPFTNERRLWNLSLKIIWYILIK